MLWDRLGVVLGRSWMLLDPFGVVLGGTWGALGGLLGLSSLADFFPVVVFFLFEPLRDDFELPSGPSSPLKT